VKPAILLWTLPTVCGLLAASPVMGQQPVAGLPPSVTLEFAPDGVRFIALAADSILSSGADQNVSLEAFNSGIATGVYLYGTFKGGLESVGYGRDPSDRRYLWLTVGRSDSLEYMAMLYDVDRDLVPDYLLYRTADWRQRVESMTEYAGPSVSGIDFDISVQPACVAPRCDPATWTVHDKTRVDVPAYWFEMWRPVLALAAIRGERWLGRPVAALPRAPTQP
jgi:hypothetical protein